MTPVCFPRGRAAKVDFQTGFCTSNEATARTAEASHNDYGSKCTGAWRRGGRARLLKADFVSEGAGMHDLTTFLAPRLTTPVVFGRCCFLLPEDEAATAGEKTTKGGGNSREEL